MIQGQYNLQGRHDCKQLFWIGFK